MSKLIIKRVRGIEHDIDHKVGVYGVTRIDKLAYSPEPFCERIFYQIYKGEKLHSVVNDQAVAEIEYQ